MNAAVGVATPRATARRGLRRHARTAVRFMLFGAAGFIAGMGLALLVPLAFGARPLTVLSGSMEPALGTGDVTVVKRIAPLDARPGDIVTFLDPAHEGRLITHRVQRLEARGKRIAFVTRGDANNVSERWQVDAGGEISRVTYRIPELGHLLLFARTNKLLPLIFALALGLLLFLELISIWRPAKEERA